MASGSVTLGVSDYEDAEQSASSPSGEPRREIEIELEMLIRAAPSAFQPEGHIGYAAPAVPSPRVSASLVLALDFGHRHVAAAMCDRRGLIVGARRSDLEIGTSSTDAIDVAVQLVGEITGETGVCVGDLCAAVAGVPGPVDARSGIMLSAMFLSDWAGVAPASEISRALGVETTVLSGARLGAWGEHTLGAGRGIDDFAYVSVSDVVRAGLVVNGTPFEGTRGLSGEIGHTPTGSVDRCGCGNYGCVDATSSTVAIRRKLALAHSGLADGRPLASLTDPVSETVLSEAGRGLGVALAGVCNILNPTALIIGDESGDVSEVFVAAVRESVSRCVQYVAAASVDVTASRLGRHASLIGAIATAVTQGKRVDVNHDLPTMGEAGKQRAYPALVRSM